MEKVHIIIKMAVNTKENGEMMINMASESKFMQMAINIKENLKMVKRMEKEFTIMLMEIDMKVSGFREKDME